MSARLMSLQAKLDILSAKIDQEVSRPSPCSLRLQALKKQRLRLKDKINEIGRALRTFAGRPARI